MDLPYQSEIGNLDNLHEYASFNIISSWPSKTKSIISKKDLGMDTPTYQEYLDTQIKIEEEKQNKPFLIVLDDPASKTVSPKESQHEKSSDDGKNDNSMQEEQFETESYMG